jgi:hypothetical protein
MILCFNLQVGGWECAGTTKRAGAFLRLTSEYNLLLSPSLARLRWPGVEGGIVAEDA